MRTTIDKAGRVVIPRVLREQVGLTAGEVEIAFDGTGIRIEPIAGDGLTEERGWLVIPASGATIGDDDVRSLRRADQR